MLTDRFDGKTTGGKFWLISLKVNDAAWKIKGVLSTNLPLDEMPQRKYIFNGGSNKSFVIFMMMMVDQQQHTKTNFALYSFSKHCSCSFILDSLPL